MELPEQPLYMYEYDGMVLSCIFPAAGLDKIKEMALHDDDVMIATYPKCGTTWMQAILDLVNSRGDTESFDKVSVFFKHLYLEAHYPGMPQSMLDQYTSTPSPHMLKTHLQAKYFEKTMADSKTKFIVVLRNPKDALVSFYHFYRMNATFLFNGTWDEFFNLHKEKKLCYGDYFEHVLSWWKLRDDPNVLTLKYEDMLASPEDAVTQVARHLGKTLSDDIVEKIVQKSSFKSMKENPTIIASLKNPVVNEEISPFFRKGKSGDWKNYFSKEQSDHIDEQIELHFTPVGLHWK